MSDLTLIIIAALASGILSGIAGYLIKLIIDQKSQLASKNAINQQINMAQERSQEILIEAKEESLQIRLESEKEINNQISDSENIVSNNSEAPSLELIEQTPKINREDAINASKRIKFENNNVLGSISLKGAVIDDLRFKKYKTELNGDENIVLLNPRDVENGYIVETGWASNSKNIDLPNYNTIWNIKGNTVLTPTSPITLSWTCLLYTSPSPRD